MQLSFLLSSTQGTPADVLYKGTITRLIKEDSATRAERERDEALSKAHVVYEGISAHILTYDREYFSQATAYFMSCPAITFILSISQHKPTIGVVFP